MQADTTTAAAVPAPAAPAPPGAFEAPSMFTGSPGTTVEHLEPVQSEQAPLVPPVAPTATPPVAQPVAPVERPDWLLSKYKTVEDQAKAYVEAEKMLGRRNAAPDKYELKVPEDMGIQEFPEEDLEFFKEAGLNNEQAQKVADLIYTQIAPQMRDMQIKQERAQLQTQWKTDANATGQRLQSIKQWADQHLPPGAVKAMSSSSSGVSAMWDMMQSGARGMVQPAQAAATMSREDLFAAVSDPRYKTDENYRREVEAKAKAMYDR